MIDFKDQIQNSQNMVYLILGLPVNFIFIKVPLKVIGAEDVKGSLFFWKRALVIKGVQKKF